MVTIFGGAPMYHFKILVPAAAAGRIIGKGGTTIAQLQKDAGARVKMSKASEFYPGTTERVCLISGPIEGILKINDFFMENFNASTSMKILVPNSTAGMIIGKGGSYIKQIKEESGAYVQISQKCTDLSLPERCVTIVGELENIRIACAMILNKIVEDSSASSVSTAAAASSSFCGTSSSRSSPSSSPNSMACAAAAAAAALFRGSTGEHSRTSSINTQAALTSSTSSSASSVSTTATSPTQQHHQQQPATSSFSLTSIVPSTPTSNNTHNNHLGHFSSSCSNINSNSNNNHYHHHHHSINSTSITSGHSSSSNHPQIIETIKMVLQVSGYGEDAVSEISSAMSTLASYGVLGVGLGLF